MLDWLVLRAVESRALTVAASHREISRSTGLAPNSVLAGARGLVARSLIAVADPGSSTAPRRYDVTVLGGVLQILKQGGAANSEAPQISKQGGAANFEAPAAISEAPSVENMGLRGGAANFEAPVQLASISKNTSREELASCVAAVEAVVRSRCRRFSPSAFAKTEQTCRNLRKLARSKIPGCDYAQVAELVRDIVTAEAKSSGGEISWEHYGGIYRAVEKHLRENVPVPVEPPAPESGVGIIAGPLVARRPPQMERVADFLEALRLRVVVGEEG